LGAHGATSQRVAFTTIHRHITGIAAVVIGETL
jgi:hypothetical protein